MFKFIKNLFKPRAQFVIFEMGDGTFHVREKANKGASFYPTERLCDTLEEAKNYVRKLTVIKIHEVNDGK